MKVDETFNNKTISVPVGDTIALDIAENPSTGFRWALENPGTPVCALKTDDFVPAGPNPGAGGTRKFTFLVREAGDGTILLRNRRKWGGADTGRDFTLHVRAAAN